MGRRGRSGRSRSHCRAPDSWLPPSGGRPPDDRQCDLTALFASGYSRCIHVRPTSSCAPSRAQRRHCPSEARCARRASTLLSAPLSVVEGAGNRPPLVLSLRSVPRRVRMRPSTSSGRAEPSRSELGRHTSGAPMRRWLFGPTRITRNELAAMNRLRPVSGFALRSPRSEGLGRTVPTLRTRRR